MHPASASTLIGMLEGISGHLLGHAWVHNLEWDHSTIVKFNDKRLGLLFVHNLSSQLWNVRLVDVVTKL